MQCFDKFQHCWTCTFLSKARPMFKIRSLVVEKLLNSISRPCSFEVFGCSEVISGLDHHELNCEYVVVDCVVHSCYTRHSMKHLLEHILHPHDRQQQHLDLQLPGNLNNIPNSLLARLSIPNSFYDFETSSYDTRAFVWNRVFYLRLNNAHNFFLSCLASNIFREVSFAMLYLGTSKESERFYCKLRFFTENMRREVTTTKKVIPVSVGKMSAMIHPDSFKLSYEEILDFWKESEKMKVLFCASVHEAGDENNNNN